MTTTTNPEALKESARQQDLEAAASFDRCDTDGFLSQWANRLGAELDRTNARILEDGGIAAFPALFDLAGRWVPARIIDTKYGARWLVLDATGKSTGVFLPYRPKRRTTLAAKGYVEGSVTRPARAIIAGSDPASCRVIVIATDRDHDAPSSIIECDRWAVTA